MSIVTRLLWIVDLLFVLPLITGVVARAVFFRIPPPKPGLAHMRAHNAPPRGDPKWLELLDTPALSRRMPHKPPKLL